MRTFVSIHMGQEFCSTFASSSYLSGGATWGMQREGNLWGLLGGALTAVTWNYCQVLCLASWLQMLGAVLMPPQKCRSEWHTIIQKGTSEDIPCKRQVFFPVCEMIWSYALWEKSLRAQRPQSVKVIRPLSQLSADRKILGPTQIQINKHAKKKTDAKSFGCFLFGSLFCFSSAGRSWHWPFSASKREHGMLTAWDLGREIEIVIGPCLMSDFGVSSSSNMLWLYALSAQGYDAGAKGGLGSWVRKFGYPHVGR